LQLSCEFLIASLKEVIFAKSVALIIELKFYIYNILLFFILDREYCRQGQGIRGMAKYSCIYLFFIYKKALFMHGNEINLYACLILV
jgi:hypothetical protein